MATVRAAKTVLLGTFLFPIACSSSDDDTLPTDCRSIEASHYDAARKCIEMVAVDGVCFTASRGARQSGEQVCLRSPDGQYYQTDKDFNECLAGPGWVT